MKELRDKMISAIAILDSRKEKTTNSSLKKYLTTSIDSLKKRTLRYLAMTPVDSPKQSLAERLLLADLKQVEFLSKQTDEQLMLLYPVFDYRYESHVHAATKVKYSINVAIVTESKTSNITKLRNMKHQLDELVHQSNVESDLSSGAIQMLHQSIVDINSELYKMDVVLT